jgi:TetR/AcrR family transcriptional regulator
MKRIPQQQRATTNRSTNLTQEKIFDAALKEFAENGYKNASTNALIKAAGISKGSLFQYFTSKKVLFEMVLQFAVGKAKDRLRHIRDISESSRITERLELILRSGFDFINEHPLVARIYFHLLQSGEAPFSIDKIAAFRKEANSFIAEILTSAKERKELREDLEAEKVAFLLNSMFESLLRAYYTEFLAPDLGLYKGNPSQLKSWIDSTLHFIQTGLLATKEDPR